MKKQRNLLITIIIIALLVSIGILNKPVDFAYGSSTVSAAQLKSDINQMIYFTKNNPSKTYDYFVKVTKECYPDAKIKIDRKEFVKLAALSNKKSLTPTDIKFINSMIEKLKSSYYGKKSAALIKLYGEELRTEINKNIRDVMKNQHCTYSKAKQEVVGGFASEDPSLIKEYGLTKYQTLSTQSSREQAFVYARPYDVASVLSNRGDLILYSVWDGWVKEVIVGDDGTICYLNIYEALPDGNWDSVHRYGSPSVCKGAYNSWVVNSKRVYIERYPDYGLSQRAYNVSVKMYYGKPYNYNILNKYDANRSYCSQNVWTGFWSYGTDLDSNLDIPALYVTHPWAVDFELYGVLPDSIYLSPPLELVLSG